MELLRTGRSPVVRVAFAVLAVSGALSLASTLYADEPPTAEGKGFATTEPPPEFPKGQDEFLAPMDRANLREWLTILRGQIERLQARPPTSPESTDLANAWDSILQPRLGRMLGLLRTWEEAGKWSVTEGETPFAILRSDQWEPFTNDIARLATELYGAWKQYQNVQVERRLDIRDSPQLVPYPAPGQVLAYPVAPLYRSILDRQAAGILLGHWHAGSYSHLFNRFRLAWDWGYAQTSKWWKYWMHRQVSDQHTLEQRAILAATRDTLAQTLLGLQVMVGALQNSEEERLRGGCSACKTDDATLKEMAETALRDMSTARLEGERYQGDSYSKYGTLLRSWVRRQRAAVGVLDLTDRRIEEGGIVVPASPPKAPSDGPQPPK